MATKPNTPVAASAGQGLVITRIFDAPRELVWKAWTNCEHLKRWWGPEHFTAPACKIDLRVGGKYLFCMRSPQGQDYWSTGVYREIVAPSRLAYTDNFADAQGNVVPASHYGLGRRVARRNAGYGYAGRPRGQDAHDHAACRPSGRSDEGDGRCRLERVL